MRYWWLAVLAVTLVQAQPAPAPDQANVAYGPHPRNVLDLWLAKSGKPTPLLVFIHGGGFVNGDKSAANPQVIRRALAAGVSFAAINYRYRTAAPIQDVLRDCARAIQFLRSRATEWGLDKTRVASMGGSAGAGTSLWLAFHDDLAEPRHPDPVRRESTRLVAAAATSAQATYDILRWEEFLGEAAQRYGSLDDVPAFYGLRSLEEARGPAGAKIRADVDMLALVTKDDPPVYLVSSQRHAKLDNRGALLHSPLHAQAVKKACDAAGVTATVKVVDEAPGRAADADPAGFLLERLTSR